MKISRIHVFKNVLEKLSVKFKKDGIFKVFMPATNELQDGLRERIINGNMTLDGLQRLVFVGLVKSYQNDLGLIHCRGSDMIWLRGGDRTYHKIDRDEALEFLVMYDKNQDSPIIEVAQNAIVLAYCQDHKLPEEDYESLLFIVNLSKLFPKDSIQEMIDVSGHEPREFISDTPGVKRLLSDNSYRREMAEIYVRKILPKLKILN